MWWTSVTVVLKYTIFFPLTKGRWYVYQPKTNSGNEKLGCFPESSYVVELSSTLDLNSAPALGLLMRLTIDRQHDTSKGNTNVTLTWQAVSANNVHLGSGWITSLPDERHNYISRRYAELRTTIFRAAAKVAPLTVLHTELWKESLDLTASGQPRFGGKNIFARPFLLCTLRYYIFHDAASISSFSLSLMKSVFKKCLWYYVLLITPFMVD